MQQSEDERSNAIIESGNINQQKYVIEIYIDTEKVLDYSDEVDDCKKQ